MPKSPEPILIKQNRLLLIPFMATFFYSVGGKVYQYDMGLKQSFLMLDKGNEKISVLKFHRFLSPKYTNGDAGAPALANKLIVASFNPTGPEGANGTMELYDVPQVNGQINLAQSFAGLAKIVDLTYRDSRKE